MYDKLLSMPTTLSEAASEPIQEPTADNQKILNTSSDSKLVVGASNAERENSNILTNITEHVCNRTVLELGNKT